MKVKDLVEKIVDSYGCIIFRHETDDKREFILWPHDTSSHSVPDYILNSEVAMITMYFNQLSIVYTCTKEKSNTKNVHFEKGEKIA